MESSELISAISTVGFPIVCCGAMWYLMRTEMKDMKSAIDNNTKVIQRLIDWIEAKTNVDIDGNKN